MYSITFKVLHNWVETIEVDGFCFDLGAILGGDDNRLNLRCGFFDALGPARTEAPQADQ